MEFAAATTEAALRDWRYGSTASERLAADVLSLAQFVDIEPIQPLGGPDGGRDIFCRKGRERYVAAVYFPNGDVTFPATKDKFEHDLARSLAHGREGFAFVTNQYLTSNERDQLHGLAADSARLPEVLDRERIRVHLDSPRGYGARMNHLRIPMNPAEQFAYFANSRGEVEAHLERQWAVLQRIATDIDGIRAGQQRIGRTVEAIEAYMGEPLDLGPSRIELVSGPLVRDATGGQLSLVMDIALVLAVHRWVCPDLPTQLIGRLRNVEALIALPEAPLDQPLSTTSPAEIGDQLTELLGDWNQAFPNLDRHDPDRVVEEIAKFHARFLRIHPFADGNGRVARALLFQQAIDLFGEVDPGVMDAGVGYYEALRAADAGDSAALETLIARTVHLGFE